MPSYKKLINDLKDVLSGLYLKHGSEEEIIILSQILDEFIVEKQKSSLNLINIQNKIRSLIQSISEIMFEVDISNDCLLYSKNNMLEDLGLDGEDVYDRIINGISKKYIHKDDYLKFRDLFRLENVKRSINDGEEKIVLECRMLIEGVYSWMLYTVEYFLTEESDSLIILIYAKDIGLSKPGSLRCTEVDVKVEAEHLYDKIYSQKIIEKYLGDEGKHGKHALVIVELEWENDNLLENIKDRASLCILYKLRRVFRNTDIVGMESNDKFIILMKDIYSEDLAIKKVDDALNIFKQSFEVDGDKYRIRGRVGLSMYDRDGNDFDKLYTKANLELYKSKQENDCDRISSEIEFV